MKTPLLLTSLDRFWKFPVKAQQLLGLNLRINGLVILLNVQSGLSHAVRTINYLAKFSTNDIRFYAVILEVDLGQLKICFVSFYHKAPISDLQALYILKLIHDI